LRIRGKSQREIEEFVREIGRMLPFSLWDFPLIQQGFEPVMFSTDSKSKNLFKILHGTYGVD